MCIFLFFLLSAMCICVTVCLYGANYCKDNDNLLKSLYVKGNKFRFYTLYLAKSVPK